jgi:hypothetical protein
VNGILAIIAQHEAIYKNIKVIITIIMKAILPDIKHIAFNVKSIPLAFLGVTVLGFGLLANRLGYYQDDWPYIFYAFNKGIPSLTQELFYDSRPNAAWLYIGAFYLLGFRPIAWHLAAAFLRWLTATLLWFFFRQIWPNKIRQATFAILLFIIHPFFLIQPYSVNSILYWAGYLFFAASLLIMAWNVNQNNQSVPLTIMAVFLEGLHLFTSEYFVGMVMVRPLILFWLLQAKETNRYRRLTKVISLWLPYLGALAAYVIWRIFLYVPPPVGDRNTPVILYALFTNTLPTFLRLIRTALQDSVIITFTSWYRTLTPELLSFKTIFNWFIVIVTFATVIALFMYLSRLKLNADDRKNNDENWLPQGLTLGLLTLILGILPVWMIGQDIVTHKNQFAGSRFGIGSTLGAALILTVLIEGLIDSYRKKIAVISTCVALAVSMHLSNAKDFSYSWEKQIRFQQELAWRAPEIKPGTAIVTDEEILGYMGQYAVSFAIITTYQPGNIDTPPYWYFPFYYTYPDLEDFIRGIPVEHSKLTMEYKGQSTDSLIISFNPEMNRCLWVLRPDEVSLRLISDDMRELSRASAVDRIGQNNGLTRTPPESIYGKLENQGWCYYFEKADLARQFGQWDEVVSLWEQAKTNGEQAENGFEYVPFIEGYAHQADWEMVRSLTRTANKISKGLEPILCDTLDQLSKDTPVSSQRDQTILELKTHLECEKYQ